MKTGQKKVIAWAVVTETENQTTYFAKGRGLWHYSEMPLLRYVKTPKCHYSEVSKLRKCKCVKTPKM